MTLRPQVVTPRGPALLAPGAPARVCIVLLSGIGDAVHGLPLANDLKLVRPRPHVTWVAEPGPAQLLAHHPAVDRVVVYRSRDGVSGLAALRREMAGSGADLTVNAQRYLKSVWPTLLSGAAVRIGLPPSKTRDGVRFVHTHVLEEGPWRHTQDLFLDFRGALGVDRDAPVRWDLAFSAEEDERGRAFFSRMEGRPVASLVLTSANPRKDWRADRWAALADALCRDFGFRVLLLGGPSTRERSVAAEVLRKAHHPPMDGLGDSLRDLMVRIRGSSLVVAPDTGPLHVAHALGVPVVGLFGHTNPWRVGPWRDFRDLVVDAYTDPGDAPDPSGYAPKAGRMDAITVEAVLEKVARARSTYL